MVMTDRAPRKFQPRYVQYGPEKLSPKGWPPDARLAKNHLMASHPSPTSIRNEATFEIRPPTKLSATINAKAPRNHHTMVIASPVKVRSGRPGTRVREVSHF